jgi:hypothetical protein
MQKEYIIILTIVDMAMKNGFIHPMVFATILLIALLALLIARWKKSE